MIYILYSTTRSNKTEIYRPSHRTPLIPTPPPLLLHSPRPPPLTSNPPQRHRQPNNTREESNVVARLVAFEPRCAFQSVGVGGGGVGVGVEDFAWLWVDVLVEVFRYRDKMLEGEEVG